MTVCPTFKKQRLEIVGLELVSGVHGYQDILCAPTNSRS